MLDVVKTRTVFTSGKYTSADAVETLSCSVET